MSAPFRPPHPWLLPQMTAGLMVGILLGRAAALAGQPAWPAALIGLAASIACALLWHGKYRTSAVVLAALFLGCLLSWSAYNPPLPIEGSHQICGVVTQEIHLREDGQVQTILSDVTLDGQPWRSDAYWTYYLDEAETLPEALIPGARVSFGGRLYHPSGAENPDGFDFREYLLQRGVHFGVYGSDDLSFPRGCFSLPGFLAALRHRMSHRLMAVMGDEAGAYASAMLLGTRDFIPEEDSEAFRKLGIAHILSVSGYHVGVLMAMLSIGLKKLKWQRSRKLVLRCVLLWVYCLLTGGSAPVVRAALLALLWELSRIRHRQASSLHLLCAAAAVQLIFSPCLLTSPSFQLTYGAMLGLTLIQPALKRRRKPRKKAAKAFWQVFTASIAVQLGLLPFQLFWFGELPLLSLLVNIATATLTTGLMSLYWLTLGFLWLPGMRELFGWISAQVTHVLLEGIRLLAASSGFSLWTRRPDVLFLLGWALLMLGIIPLLPLRLARKQQVMRLTGLLLMATLLLPLPHRETTYIQFSVGEADAALLHDQDAVVVIDAGEDGRALSDYLHQRRLSVDLLILTHLHSDHAGGIQALLDTGIPVEQCCLPIDAARPAIDPGLTELLDALAATGTKFTCLQRGDVLPLPSGSLTALWPVTGATRPLQDANHASLVLLADLRGTTLLLTGDLTSRYENYAAVPADILKAAHHGSSGSTSTAFLSAVNPQVLLLSCGTEEREVSLAERAGTLPVYSTYSQGAITIRFDEDLFRIYPLIP